MLSPAYTTKLGKCFNNTIEQVLDSKKVLKNKSVDLIFTSPPFPLKRKKKYGNLNGEDYINWLVSVFSGLLRTLKDNGSIVIEIGNAWDAGVPVMSILPMKTLLALVEKNGLYLCQQFVWYNKAKLPTPAQWVNVKRVRVKDAFTHIWWLSKTPFPKANNKKVLVEYSDSMKALLKTQKYNFGKRPSEHVIGEKSFLKNNSGAIPSNVLISSNTQSSSDYLRYCKENNLTPHPARMPSMLPEFFIEFLTEQGNVVLDPFGGSNTTGEVCEKLKRKWISVEPELNYIQSSKGRFYNKLVKDNVKNN